MKTKIATFLICFSLFIASVAFADGAPESRPKPNKQAYLGTPLEIPKPLELRLDVQISMFLADLFDLQWRPTIAEEESMIAEMKKEE